MPYSTDQVTVGESSTLIITSAAGAKVTIVVPSAGKDVFVGASGVDDTDGHYVEAAVPQTFTLWPGESLYGATGSGNGTQAISYFSQR